MRAEPNAHQRARHAPYNRAYTVELGVRSQSEEHIHRTGCACAVPGISPHKRAYTTKPGVHCRTRYALQNKLCITEPMYTAELSVFHRTRCAPKPGVHCTSKCSQGSPGELFPGPWPLLMGRKMRPILGSWGGGRQEPLQPASHSICFPDVHLAPAS